MPDAGVGYRGDITAEAAWETLQSDPKATLIDVRTVSEWAFVGVPSLDVIGKAPVFIEWQTVDGSPVSDFASKLAAELEARGVGAEAPLLFLCRSGSRSRAAAQSMAAAGFKNCFNIGPGFEGPLDGDRHRGNISGWRKSGLPWSQT